jgi:hypothetical protein
MLRKSSEKNRKVSKSLLFSPLSLSLVFFLSIGENRESLFYKHWLLEEGRKDRTREEKYPRRKRINFLHSLRPTMLIARCINIGPKKADAEEEKKETKKKKKSEKKENNEHEHLLLYANRREKKAFRRDAHRLLLIK